MIDILNREDLFSHLTKLNADDEPAFGNMTPQHMVEHLVFAVCFSNGKLPQQHHYPEEKREKIKAYLLAPGTEITQGFRSPVLPVDKLTPLQYKSLEEAISVLDKELDALVVFFKENPDAAPINPTMGELAYPEWIVFHNKHFLHHFKQFRLIE